jgi:hypothetical protein
MHGHYSSTSRTTRKGFPPATTPSGMSFVTTLPAPITERRPIVTPGQIIAPPLGQTSFLVEIEMSNRKDAAE